MCFSFQASILAWFIALFTSFIILYFSAFISKKIKYIWFAIFLLTFSQIQIMEAILWSTENYKINNFITIMIYYLLWLQPLINVLGLFLYKYSIIKLSFTTILYYLLPIIYYSFIMIYSLFFMDNSHFMSHVNNNNHIIWCNSVDKYNYFLNGFTNNKILNFFIGSSYMIGLILPPALTFDYDGVIIMVYSLLSYLFTKMLFLIDEYASVWCYIAIGYSFVCIVCLFIFNN